MNITLIAALGLWIFSSLCTIWGTWLIFKKFKNKNISDFEAQPVSILKPIKNLKTTEVHALESFFELNYPYFELIFSFSSIDDPSIPLVQKLIRKYPWVESQLVIEHHENIENPKINNLVTPYRLAKNDLVMISDCNIRVERDYLQLNLSSMKENTGLVTAVIAGRNPTSFFGHVEIAALNTFSARWMLIAKEMGTPVVMGKSMLFRKSDFDRFGGVKTLGCYIAEDFMAGQAMKYLGKEVAILPQPIEQNLQQYDGKTFFNRQIRWGRLRKSQSPIAFFFEPLTTALFSGFLGAISLSQLFAISFWSVLFLHLTIWYLLDALQLFIMGNHLSLRMTWAWLFRESTYLPTWFYALCGRKVDWQGKKMLLNAGGFISNSVNQ